MIRAWRLADGRYRVAFRGFQPGGSTPNPLRRWLVANGGVWVRPEEWTIPEAALDGLGAEKVYGVITGPSSCGCEPAMFRWVTGREVEAGVTNPISCSSRTKPDWQRYHLFCHFNCPIIEVLGEADVAEAVYEAEFKGKLEAIA